MSISAVNNRPIILTPGEPAGIGPDIVIQAAQQGFLYPTVVVADPVLLQARAALLKLPLKIYQINTFEEIITANKAGSLNVFPVPLQTDVAPGKPQISNAQYVLQTLRVAVTACLQKQGAALVTGPVHKAIMNAAGIPFQGHTHYLAELSQSKTVVMFFISQGLRLALVTDHLPLKAVSRHITQKRLTAVLTCLQFSLQHLFKISSPKIHICGLNPHAGENGYLGTEEQRIIIPVLEKLRQKGLHLAGPLSADTAFTPALLAQCDAVVAMYHDQGLPVLKRLAFGEAANITLGLPFIRTSVDHGTALELAGTGKADANSLRYVLSVTRELIYAAAT